MGDDFEEVIARLLKEHRKLEGMGRGMGVSLTINPIFAVAACFALHIL